MITTQNTASVSTSGIKSAVSFGIKDSGLAHIFNVLRNQLYTDKIGAVVREYSANACDANVEAGTPNVPIVISLPSQLNKVLKIRDFGRGLSQQDIQDIYCFYGESTKRQSNAFIGQLGLGSKSAFAYGDNFVINSFTDGIVRSYNAFIDPSGIGQIALLSETPTEERNGVEIVIPVKMEDAPHFTKAVKNYLRFFKVKPTIIGMTKEESESTFEGAISQGEGWKFYRNISSPHAVMGNIAYPIALSSMKLDNSNADDKMIANLLNAAMVIDFQIGELDVAASREGLQYTAHTLHNIRVKMKMIADNIIREIQTQIDRDAKSEYHALLLLSKMYENVQGFGYIRQIIKGIKFKGSPLSMNCYIGTSKRSIDKQIKFRAMRYRKNWNGNIQASETAEFQVRGKNTLVFNDLGNYNSGARNARYLASQGDNDVFLFTPQIVKIIGAEEKLGTIKKDDNSYSKQIAEIKKLNGFADSDFILASSIVIPVAHVGIATGKVARTGVLLFKPSNANSWRAKNAWDEVNTDLKNGSGVYVQVNNNRPVINDNRKEPSTLASIIAPFKATIDGNKIIGVTKAQMSKLGSGWVSLSDKIVEEFDKYVTANNLNLDKITAYRYALPMLRDLGGLALISEPKTQAIILKSLKDKEVHAILSEVYAVINSDKQGNNGKLEAASLMMTQLEYLGLPSTSVNKKHSLEMAENIKKDFKKVCEKFPMIGLVDTSYLRWRTDEKVMRKIADYLNA
jgi:hypothetical protein